jgi:hypothetical protein
VKVSLQLEFDVTVTFAIEIGYRSLILSYPVRSCDWSDSFKSFSPQ